ncbi:MAG TPA: ribonuclease III [Candidatus Eremiobacteraeota bacterium]|nr:MAG: Ribonuclease 3 [bacterium ADurb.Bin363]HPZ07894.1 ribonuclease III [Candidatus Eremiobacteraeota bacterium]
MSISAKRQLDLCRFERKIDYRFQNRLLIHNALIHKSYADEKGWNHVSCNERLELLGDAVLDLVVVEYLYKKYPNHTEGQITKLKGFLVCGDTLFRLSERLEMKEFLLVGRELQSSENARKLKTVLADAFEAIIGSIYLDGTWDKAKKFIEKNVLEELTELTTGKYYNYKSALQEIAQKEFKSVPEYAVLKEEGPEHCKYFNVSVSVNGKEMGRGKGDNKKEAEQGAAREALKKIREQVFWKTMKYSVTSWFQWNKKGRKRK